MTDELFHLAGGLGLFLLGMIVMTDGLRSLAGDALNRTLYRFTKSPLSGTLSGAVVTAIVQSSSATTVATIGFVSAGLLTFPQALGIVWGANVGTTITGWLVALIGFKISLGPTVMLLLLVGTMLRLFGRRRLRDVGWAVAGFALILVGIDEMRAAMEPFQTLVAPETLPGDTLGGRLVLVLVGAGITLVTQSSSAGVAMALTALNAGAIGFGQAAALVIGMDVGTTSTSALATIGGSQQTKRTGFAHVIYNLFTGTGGLLTLPLYIAFVDRWAGTAITTSPELALVGFHTTFNTLGALMVLPFTYQFAALMYRVVPDTGPQLGRRLDLALLEDRSASTAALWRTVTDLGTEGFSILISLLGRELAGELPPQRLAELERAVAETRRYADRVPIDPADGPSPLLVATMHCLDHLERLINRCRQQTRLVSIDRVPLLASRGTELKEALQEATESLKAEHTLPAEDRIKAISDSVRAEQGMYRRDTLASIGPEMRLEEAIARLDAARWLSRTAYHASRIAHHLRASDPPRSATR